MKRTNILKAAVVLLVLIFVGPASRNYFKREPTTAPAARPSRQNPLITAGTVSAPLIDESEQDVATVTNRFFLTADVLWDEPIPEQAFARFHDWAEKYRHTPATERAALEAEGIELAKSRRQALIALIQSDPERALDLAVPVAVRRALPPSVVELLEERISGRGNLAVLAALAEPGKEHEVIPSFRTATIGTSELEAFVYGRRLGEPTRNNIPLNGIAVENRFAVNANALRILEPEEAAEAKTALRAAEAICAVSGLPSTANNQAVAAEVGGQTMFLCQPTHALELNDRIVAAESGPPSPDGDSAPEASTWTEGLKKLLLIRVDFPDLANAPLSDAAAIGLISNLNNFYAEMSYGRTGYYLNGNGSDYTPTFRMSQPAAYYGTNNYYNQLRSEARNAATAAGYVLTDYNLDVICMGSVPGFGWAGLAYVGAAGAWLRNSFGTGVAGHELGHNYGLNHANFWDTSGQSVIGPGTSSEYADSFDTMGSASAGNNHFSARYKSYLNWLTANDTVTATSNGTYRIYAHDNPNSSGVRGLRIVKNSNTNYWVELRQKFTSNKWLMSGGGLRWAQNGNQKSHLLDTTPGSTDLKNDAAIVIGRTFSDQQSGIHITPIGKGGTSPESLDVVVNLGFFPSNLPPSVDVTASASTAATGVALSFTAAASDPNDDELAYYWDFGDGNFGTNSPVASKSWSSAGEYVVRCVVSDMKGGVGSKYLVVTIGSPTTYRISGQIAGTSGPVQGVRVYVSTTRMTYTDSDGAYSIVGLPAGSYTVNASLENCTFTADGFANPVSVGPNKTDIHFLATDTGLAPPTITSQPLSQTVSPGANVAFSVGAGGSTPLYYQWRFNGANIAGATASTYAKTNVQSTNGGNYSVVVSNLAGTATTANAVLTVNTPPVITGQPQSQTVIAGDNATFTVTATGSTPLYYQWRLNGTNIAGANAISLTRVGAQLTDAGIYTAVVTNSLGAVTSSPAALGVNVVLNASATSGGTLTKSPDQSNYAPNTVVTLTAAPVSVFTFAGWSGDVSGTNNPLILIMTTNLNVVANFVSPVPDLIVDNPQATLSGNWTTDTSATDKYGTDYTFAATTPGGSATATATFTPSLNTAGRYDVYVWFPTIPKGSANAQFQISSSEGDLTMNVSQSGGSAGWQLVAAGRQFAQGTNGFVRLSNNTGQGGKNIVADAARWVYSENQSAAPPTIVAQPSPQTAILGSSASFSAIVTGTQPLTCQWCRNGAAIPGATNGALVLQEVQAADAGDYTVSVTNAAGSVISSVATLTVLVPPQILTPPESQRVLEGRDAVFTVAANGTGPLAYQWRFNAEPLSDGTNSTLLVTNVQLADAGNYDIMVSNAGGTVTSAAASLAVSTRPVINSIAMLSDGSAQLTLTGTAGDAYAIESSTNLLQWALVSTFTNITGTAQITDSAAAGHNYRFYRARLME